MGRGLTQPPPLHLHPRLFWGGCGVPPEIPDRPLEASEPLHPPHLPHYSPSPHCSPLLLLPPLRPRLCLLSPPLPPPPPSTAAAPDFSIPPARPPVPADPVAPAPHSLPSAPPQPTARPPGRPCQLFSCLHSSRPNPTLRPWLPSRPCTARSNTRLLLQRPAPTPPSPPSFSPRPTDPMPLTLPHPPSPSLSTGHGLGPPHQPVQPHQLVQTDVW